MKTCIVGLGCASLLLCARFAIRADSISSTPGRPLLAPIDANYTPFPVFPVFGMSGPRHESRRRLVPVFRETATSCSISHGLQSARHLKDRAP